MNAAETPRRGEKPLTTGVTEGHRITEKVTVVVHTKTQPLELICMEI
jgi:hypothetical protein